MKPTHVLLIALCGVFAFSCANHNRIDAPPAPPAPVQSPTAVHENVAGGLATPEPGETESAEFKGTVGFSEKKREGIQPVLLKAVRTGKHVV
jgi:hypothetical protein